MDPEVGIDGQHPCPTGAIHCNRWKLQGPWNLQDHASTLSPTSQIGSYWMHVSGPFMFAVSMSDPLLRLTGGWFQLTNKIMRDGGFNHPR